jgi:hypothetical protein
MVKYYPEVVSIQKLMKEHPEMHMVDEKEELRLQFIKDRKARGKGAPRKSKSKGMFSCFFSLRIVDSPFLFTEESRRAGRKRKVA